jgi:hypothetical protein
LLAQAATQTLRKLGRGPLFQHRPLGEGEVQIANRRVDFPIVLQSPVTQSTPAFLTAKRIAAWRSLRCMKTNKLHADDIHAILLNVRDSVVSMVGSLLSA